MSFQNKVVLVTGASAGIGESIAENFAKEGASVAIVGRNEERLKAVAQRCQEYGAPTLIIKADVAKDEEAKTIVDKTIEKFGRLDVLVNNAGIARYASLTSPNVMETFDEVIGVNLRAVFHLTSLATPYLLESKGNIINISSALAKSYLKSPSWMAYCVAKAGLNHFSHGAALELAPSGVRVNTVSPGPVLTDMLRSLDGDWENTGGSYTPLKRISQPQEVADVVLFLASDKAKGVTGATYSVDNGVLLN